MKISRIQEIFDDRGAEAALASARAAQMAHWVIAALERGERPEPRSKTKRECFQNGFISRLIDRTGDPTVELVKVQKDRNGELVQYVLRTLDDAGNVVKTEPLGRVTLAEAREAFGRPFEAIAKAA